jgi:uncharacterized protein (UPF0332 family)
MSLNEENRNAIVNHRLQKAKNTLTEAKGIFDMCFWHSAANRLYYACYYAVTALLIKNGYVAHTHSGVVTLLNKHFVLEGIISKEQGKLYGRIFEFRQRGDYEDWVTIEEKDITPLLEPAENFIKTIEQLILTE